MLNAPSGQSHQLSTGTVKSRPHQSVFLRLDIGVQ